MLLRSSRTLPGQSCACSTAMASSPMRARGQPGRLRDLADEILDELRDVLAPLGQARHAQRHDVEAVVEVLAEAALLHLPLEIAAGRGDDAHVDRHLRRRRRRAGTSARPARAGPCPASRAACRRPRRCRACRRAPLRARRPCAGRRVRSSVPNSSSSTRSGAMAAALSTTNGPSARCELSVHDARDQLLAGAGRAADQDAAVGRRHAVEWLRAAG